MASTATNPTCWRKQWGDYFCKFYPPTQSKKEFFAEIYELDGSTLTYTKVATVAESHLFLEMTSFTQQMRGHTFEKKNFTDLEADVIEAALKTLESRSITPIPRPTPMISIGAIRGS